MKPEDISFLAKHTINIWKSYFIIYAFGNHIEAFLKSI
jgi:hypothetical protein